MRGVSEWVTEWVIIIVCADSGQRIADSGTVQRERAKKKKERDRFRSCCAVRCCD